MSDDDITRKRLAKLEAGHVHLLGIEGQPGRIANIEAEMREIRIDFDTAMAEERAARVEADKALSKADDEQDVRLRARELFDHELKTTLRTAQVTASAIVAAVFAILFVGLPKLIEWLSHFSK